MGLMTSQPKKLNAGSNSPRSRSDGTGSVPHDDLYCTGMEAETEKGMRGSKTLARWRTQADSRRQDLPRKNAQS
jgi:hypothetical protein